MPYKRARSSGTFRTKRYPGARRGGSLPKRARYAPQTVGSSARAGRTASRVKGLKGYGRAGLAGLAAAIKADSTYSTWRSTANILRGKPILRGTHPLLAQIARRQVFRTARAAACSIAESKYLNREASASIDSGSISRSLLTDVQRDTTGTGQDGFHDNNRNGSQIHCRGLRFEMTCSNRHNKPAYLQMHIIRFRRDQINQTESWKEPGSKNIVTWPGTDVNRGRFMWDRRGGSIVRHMRIRLDAANTNGPNLNVHRRYKLWIPINRNMTFDASESGDADWAYRVIFTSYPATADDIGGTNSIDVRWRSTLYFKDA